MKMRNKKCTMMCFVITVAFLLTGAAISGQADAGVYYVDNTLGNDANLGTSTNQAWKSLAKVSNSIFQPGDQILFKRGEIWREQLTINSSGTEEANIIFGAYGGGPKPVITGSDIVSGWALYTENIYVADADTINSPPPLYVNGLPINPFSQLYVDGEYHDIAHHPNSGYLIANNSDYTNSIIDFDLDLTIEQIVGTTVAVKPVPWYIGTIVAKAYDATSKKITLDGNIYGEDTKMMEGYGFYLQNKLWMLDSPKEWYYNLTAGKVYLWTAESDDPNNHIVEISNRPYGIYGIAKNFVTIKDLDIRNVDQDNVLFKDAVGINISNLNIFGGINGIVFNTISNSSINNNFIQNVLSDGIEANLVWVQDTKAKNIDILNNTINNAGNIGTPHTTYASIFVGQGCCDNAESINIKNNKINNSGYVGIMFHGNLITVQDNNIDRSCLVLDDCAGIYTSSNPKKIDDTSPSDNTIIGNTVTNSIGNCEGTIYSTYNCYTMAHGIYLDAVTYTTSVINNAVSNVDYGIFSNDGHDNNIIGNKIFLARKHALGIVSGSFTDAISAGGLAKGNIIKNNIFDYNGTYAVINLQNNAQNQSLDFGSFSNNKYCHPNTNYVIMTNVKGQPGEEGYHNGLTYTVYNLSRWQEFSGQELNSIETKTACPFEGPDPIQVCGDGNLDPGEQCDDGNIVNGDGCSSNCQTEIPCNTGADKPVCDSIVTNAELYDYIQVWYSCSACVPDLYQAIEAYFS